MKSGSKSIVLIALAANCIIAIIKFVVAIITGSSAMLAEAVHSAADTGNQIFLLIGIKRSFKSPDSAHPFGYGQEQYFWSFMVAILIFFIGSIVSLYEGFHKLSAPTEIESPWMIYVILAISMCLESYAFFAAYKEFNSKRIKGDGIFLSVHKTKDTSVAVILFEDSAALLGLSIAFVGVLLADLTGILIFDALASILIGVLLASVSFWLAYECKELLIGESASNLNLAKIEQSIKGFEEIDKTGEILTMHLGPNQILVTLSVEFKDELTTDEIEKAVDTIKSNIREGVPAATKIFIEAKNILVQNPTV